MKERFTATEVAEILGNGWSMKRVVDCTDRGLAEPAEEPQGQRRRREYSFRSLVQLRLYEMLSTWGHPRSSIKAALRVIESDPRIGDFYSPNKTGDKDTFIGMVELEHDRVKHVTILREWARNQPITTKAPSGKIVGHFLINVSMMKRKLKERIEELY